MQTQLKGSSPHQEHQCHPKLTRNTGKMLLHTIITSKNTGQENSLSAKRTNKAIRAHCIQREKQELGFPYLRATWDHPTSELFLPPVLVCPGSQKTAFYTAPLPGAALLMATAVRDSDHKHVNTTAAALPQPHSDFPGKGNATPVDY